MLNQVIDQNDVQWVQSFGTVEKNNQDVSPWEVVVCLNLAEFTAQVLSLSYLNGNAVQWGCGYKIRILLEKSGNLGGL